MHRPRRPASLLAVVALTAAGAACGAAPAASARTVWLCKPGLARNPCTPRMTTTVFSPTGRRLRVVHPRVVRRPAIDCFYVYPTVSGQNSTLSNRHVDPEERSIALYQAARYSLRCRVFAPMYRQVTLATLARTGTETPAQLAVGLKDIRGAFRDYLRHYNHGRGFVLIGQSQGAFMLRELIPRDVDSKPSARGRMLSAILLGGNVLVKHGRDVGGDFKHIRACHSARQLGCVIAYSTFDTPVVPGSFFGVSHRRGEDVLCTNPTSLRGGTGTADVISPSQPFYPRSPVALGIALLGLTYPNASTPWLEEPNAYRARCSSANHAHVLQITPINGAQTPHPSPDPRWGLHLIDANIALGNLVRIVGSETRAYLHQ